MEQNNMTNNTDKPINKPSNKRKKSITIFLVLILLAFVGYYTYDKLFLSDSEGTDNAYVNGNVINVTSQVSGTVISINADNTQFVKEGDELVKLDPQDSKIALDQAKANLATTVRTLRQQYANVKQYKAMLAQQQIALQKAENDYNRRIPLAKKNLISKEELAHTKADFLSAKAAIEVTKEQEAAAEASIAGVDLINHPNVLQAKANFIATWLTLQRSDILAPISGYVAQRNIQVGTKINPGTPLLSIVPLNQLWVDANFKESQLKNIRIGQPVTIVADVYGDSVKYHGKVIGLSAGTGSAFSLLPAQNATGNWIKIVQRVPVRVSLDPEELANHPLRIGLSTYATVNTTNKSGSSLISSDQNNTVYSTNVITQSTTEAEKIADQIIAKSAGVAANTVNKQDKTKKVTPNKAKPTTVKKNIKVKPKTTKKSLKKHNNTKMNQAKKVNKSKQFKAKTNNVKK
ncbi:efflux RND transporter periplasmic adaptor subunit [Rickettsiales bacterium LUAb2]